jgi:hypothetical protein
MIKRMMFFLILGIVIFGKLYSQEITISNNKDSLSNQSVYSIWFDAGVYFTYGSHSGDFDPTHNLRIGIGRSFRIYKLYGFIELTSHKYDPHDALSPPFLSSNKRNDIAVYAMGSIYQAFYLGVGIFHSQQDNIIGWDRSGIIISETGDRSHFGFYYLVGIGQQIDISNSISIPIGLYFRNQDYPEYSSSWQKISLRVGIIYIL